MDSRGFHLGDGAYVVPDREYAGQIWLAANHHENRVVALDPSAVNMMLLWLIRHNLPFATEALRGIGEALQTKLEEDNVA